MNTLVRRSAAAATCALFFAAASAAFAGPKEYQVTGPVVSVSDTAVVVQRGKENWEIAKDAGTKGAEALKVGDKVTVHYTMTASSVEAKPAKSAGAGKKDTAPAAAPAASPKP